ncbi:MAG TPA: hypothetical protein VMT92_05735 [Steroidobacteraceae bacterium]|nr:hypothetical protein [Steroidobacteraceae bacterium]
MDECVSLHYTAVPAQRWPALEAAWLPRVPAGKRESLARLRAPADRNASLLGVALLAHALAARGRALEDCALEYPPRAKPRLARGPDFSIAHAGGIVGCALATGGRIGLDVEPDRPLAASALRRALGAETLAALADGRLEPVRAWVMTEAVLKAAGRGVEAAARVRLESVAATLDDERFVLVPLALATAHVGYLAHEGARLELATVRHEASEFARLS